MRKKAASSRRASAAAALDRICKPAVTLGYVLAGAALLLLSLNVFADVFSRNVFNRPVDGTIEAVSGWWMVALTFFAIAVAQRSKNHINVPLLIDSLPAHQRSAVVKAGYAASAVFIAAIGWLGLQNALHQAAIGEHAVVSGLPIWPLRFAIPVSAALAVLQFTVDILRPDETADAEGGVLEPAGGGLE